VLEGYEARDIYNADEMGLFFKCLADRTLALKGETCRGGKKCEGATDGTIVYTQRWFKRVSIVIGKFAKPQCSKNIQKLPVTYYANSKEWMTSEISKDFLRTLNASFGALGRKILLFVDNCAAHSPDTSSLRNAKVVFNPLTAPVSYSLLCWM
jgi:hypothetical protein